MRFNWKFSRVLVLMLRELFYSQVGYRVGSIFCTGDSYSRYFMG